MTITISERGCVRLVTGECPMEEGSEAVCVDVDLTGMSLPNWEGFWFASRGRAR